MFKSCYWSTYDLKSSSFSETIVCFFLLQQTIFFMKFGTNIKSIRGIKVINREAEHIFSAIGWVSMKFFPTQLMWSLVYIGAIKAFGVKLNSKANMN